MKLLSLVPDEVGIYEQQVQTLQENGVDCTTLTIPGTHTPVESRSVVDYLRFYPRVLEHSFGPYDLIHANYGLTAPFALAQPRLPVVLSLWGSDLFGKYGWLSKLCARRSDAVVVMGEAMAEELDSPSHIIPHGIDFEKFRPHPKGEARSRVGWDRSARHVLFPYSAKREVKNYPRAERVVNMARTRIDGRIELHTVSGVPHNEMSLFLNAADVLLLTSKREGSPNTVKEALACNVPVVSTDVGDVRERLSDVQPSYVCQTNTELVDGLVDVLGEPRRSNGRERVQELRLERTTEKLRMVYESVL